jgi:hypothetical protein
MVDPTPTTNPVLDYLSKWSPFLLLLLGGLLAQLWTRFRSRTRRFTWRAWHTRIAIAGDVPQLGNVTVQFNGVPVNHLHVTTVEFTNDSSEDQKDVTITIAFQGTGHIISSTGTIQGDPSPIPFKNDYVALYTNATPEQIQVLNSYVVHEIPVLNRGKKAIFSMLVARDDTTQPVVIVSCNHPGTKLEFLPAGPELFGVPLNLAIWLGMATTLACVLLLVRFQRHNHPYLTPAIAWFLGAYCARIGADLVRFWKLCVRVLG